MFRNMIRSFGIRRLFLTNNAQHDNLIMGRWKPEYDDTMQSKKVYWANMDHCGCCDMKVEDEKIKMNTFRTKGKCEDSDEYILPYVITM